MSQPDQDGVVLDSLEAVQRALQQMCGDTNRSITNVVYAAKGSNSIIAIARSGGRFQQRDVQLLGLCRVLAEGGYELVARRKPRAKKKDMRVAVYSDIRRKRQGRHGRIPQDDHEGAQLAGPTAPAPGATPQRNPAAGDPELAGTPARGAGQRRGRPADG